MQDKMKIEIKKYYSVNEWIAQIEPSYIYIVKCNKGVSELYIHFEDTTLSHGVGFIVDGNENIELISESREIELSVYKISYNFFYELIFELNNDIFKTLWSNKTHIIDKEYLSVANSFLEQIEIIYNKDNYNSKDKLIINLIQCYFLDMYEHIKETTPEAFINNTNQKRDRIIKLHDLILEYKVRDITFYSEKLNISSRTLYSTTYDILGLSPKEVINSVIISNIKNIIRKTSLGNKEIADIFGFSDLSSFSQFFKRHQGQSPTKYKSSVNNSSFYAPTSCECSICADTKALNASIIR